MIPQCRGCQLNVNKKKLSFFLKVYSFKYPLICHYLEFIVLKPQSIFYGEAYFFKFDFISVLQNCLYQL